MMWPVLLPWQAYLDYGVCCCSAPERYRSFLKGLPQGGEEWLLERQVFCTATAAVRALDRGYRLSRDDYWRCVSGARSRGQLLAQEPQTPAMVHGIENEPVARDYYSLHFCVDVRTCGLVVHPSLHWMACSPDGVTDEGMLEVKCPTRECRPSVKPWHMPQLMVQIECMRKPWCDYATYHVAARRMDVIRVFRCEAYFEKMLQHLSSFGEALLRPSGPPPSQCYSLPDDLVERRLIASVVLD